MAAAANTLIATITTIEVIVSLVRNKNKSAVVKISFYNVSASVWSLWFMHGCLFTKKQ